MTHNISGSPGVHGGAGAPKNAQTPVLFVYGAVALLLAATLFSRSVLAQVVDAPAGPSPGELQCPHPKHSALHKSPRHSDEFMEPPSNDELAELPEEDGVQSQEVALIGQVHRDASRPFSIGFWGDSHIASNIFSEEMIRDLGFTNDKVLPTFIPPIMGRPGMRLPIHKYCQGGRWSYEYAYLSRQANSAFAKGLVNLESSTPGSYLWVDFRAQPLIPNLRSLDILFAPPAPGEKIVVGISVDNGAEQAVELEQGGQGIIHIHAEQAISTVKLRLIEGPLVLQGFIPKYVETPGLYLDTFGIPGATAHGWKALDPEYLKNRDNDIPYDLVMLEYGTNEGNDRSFNADKYAADLRASLQNMRQDYPASLCVLLGPPDRGVLVKRRRGKKYRHAKPPVANVLKYSRIHQRIGDIQRAVGEEYSCSYWSWQDAMGGPGAAYRWLRHSPALMARDLTHMTVPGYQRSARKFAASIRLSSYINDKAD